MAHLTFSTAFQDATGFTGTDLNFAPLMHYRELRIPAELFY
jgi:hypothetical protein